MAKKNAAPVVTDPSDWLTTQVPGLKELDQSLRCHICKDFATAPMLATCCEHTFCSLCIRRQFANTHKCPMCARTVGSENHVLKKNRELELAIEAFVGVRQHMFELLTKPKKAAASTQRQSQDQNQNQKLPDEIEESDDDIEVISEVRDPSLVPCPVCNHFFTVTEIETTHLASCLSGTGSGGGSDRGGGGFATRSKSKSPFVTASGTSTGFGGAGAVQTSIFKTQSSPAPRHQYTKLPKPGTTNIKLRDLKARLQKLGIPTHGTTQSELVQREAEWITLWNANCDARCPKSKAALLRDLDAAMRNKLLAEASSSSSSSNGAGGNSPGGIASKKRKYTAESARAYSKRENNTFKELAKRARASFKKKEQQDQDQEEEKSTEQQGVTIADDSLAPTPESKITNPTSNSSDDSRQPALDIDDEYSEDHKPASSQGKSILGSNQVPPLDGPENQKRVAATAKNAGSPVPLVGVTTRARKAAADKIDLS